MEDKEFKITFSEENETMNTDFAENDEELKTTFTDVIRGEDGYSPTVEIIDDTTVVPNTHTVKITDKEGTKSCVIKDGDSSGGDYTKLANLPTLNGVAISGNYTLGDHLGITDKTIVIDDVAMSVRIATTAQWDSEPTYIPEQGRIIVYSDFAKIGDKTYIGMKIGDGASYLVDLPFYCDDVRSLIDSHINNTTIHITQAEREFWNNKSRVSEVVGEELIFTSL